MRRTGSRRKQRRGRPEGCSVAQRRRKLRRFLARFGYVEAESNYRIGGVDALVMIKPIRGSAELEPVLHRVMADFYSRFLSPFAMNRLVDIRPVKKTAE